MSNQFDSDDKQRIEAEAQALLEEEHARRVDSFSAKLERSSQRREKSESDRAAHAIQEIHDRVRHQFYEENGYKLYTDSRGHKTWLLPEEYEWRTRHSRTSRRHRTHYSSFESRRFRLRLITVAMFLMAIVTGLIVLRENL